MMKIAPLGLLLVLVACTYNPNYTGVKCGPNDSCPNGYSCIQGNCYPESEEHSGEEPSDEVTQDDGGPDDGISEDAADAGTDDGGQAQDDGTVEDADAGGDDGGEEDACGGCPTMQYCDESETPPVCKRCEDQSHCGPGCAPCAAGEGCRDMNGTFCCFAPCSADNVCTIISCGGVDYVCRAFFNPRRYEWNRIDLDPPHWCRLSDQDGPLPDTGCRDDNYLLYVCPWDGICENGQCIPDPMVERTHSCGALFGCEGDQQNGHCRVHKKNGQSCQHNFDCESFCCSQSNNAICIAYNQPDCKITTSLFWRDVVDLRTFTAQGVTDYHNITEWSSQGSDHGTKCTGDSDCDSGHCRHFTAVGENRCEFDGCVGISNDNDIKSSYFCGTGNHDLHMTTVTNANLLPPPGTCPL